MRETFRPVLPRRTYSMSRHETQNSLNSQNNDRSACSAGSALIVLFHFKELDVEQQRGIRRNGTARTSLTVSELGRNDQRAHAADFHPGDPLVPAANHLT